MPLTALVVYRKLATLHELQTVYSYEDLIDFYEILSVNAINEERMYEEMRRNERH